MGTAPVNTKSPMHHHLRPVEGKGLKPIPLPPEVLLSSVGARASGSWTSSWWLTTSGASDLQSRLAVSLSARQPVYVEDRLGVLKMLKAGKVGSLKQGEVLYLARRGTVPIWGTSSLRVYRQLVSGRGPEGSRQRSRTLAIASTCWTSRATKRSMRGLNLTWPLLTQRDERESHTRDQGKGENGAGTRGVTEGTAEDPCELLSSEDDEVVVERAERKKKVKNKQTRAAHEKTSSRKRKQPPIRSKDRHAGAGASGAGPGFSVASSTCASTCASSTETSVASPSTACAHPSR